ncbi:MAG: dihydrolipoyllysine-residue acetyltransferase [Lautropia sp. SCN 70-15]|nr:MAG: dihydrolipoyllysine-residue acetyltransferase [Lautropia sp. SCN 70-15]
MSTIEVKVPDIGDFKEVEVIEVLVKAGDAIAVEQSLITVESDKASMEIPSSAAGVLKELRVKVGDKVSEGALLAVLEAAEGAPASAPPAEAEKAASAAEVPAQAAAGTASATAADAPAPAAPARAASAIVETAVPARQPSPTAAIAEAPDGAHGAKAHASPSVRKFARELGVDLSKVKGSGPKERITHDDVRAWVKAAIARSEGGAPASAASGGEGAGLGLIPWPKVDFAKFGPVETKPVARIRKISAANLHRNWVMIPHVTNHDEADITELEAFRVQLNQEQGKAGVKVTMLAFLIKACVSALQKFPEFNSSLDGENVVLKNYWHIGFAADTPNGLMVPVIRDADKKGIFQIAKETSELAAKAREGKLSPADMQGGTFSISSLGGIGGTYFTPIINAPEVAILGVCRSFTKPVWNGEAFEPRLILPLSLSWDHRVVDGAAAARFNVHLAQLLADFRRVML